MRQTIASITHKLGIPAVCVLCQQYHYERCAVCNYCMALFKKIDFACSYCSLPLPDETFLICGSCIKEKPIFDQVITTYCFEQPLRTLIHEFKYQEALYLRGFLAKLMLEAMNSTPLSSQCLVPVPLHPIRLRERGFNQAAELCKLLARKLKIPYELRLCEKIIHTVPQVGLSAKLRQKNLHQAFIAKPTTYKHITLIDDLFTTGSTANELAKTLKQQGVEQVDLWCCARATPS